MLSLPFQSAINRVFDSKAMLFVLVISASSVSIRYQSRLRFQENVPVGSSSANCVSIRYQSRLRFQATPANASQKRYSEFQSAINRVFDSKSRKRVAHSLCLYVSIRYQSRLRFQEAPFCGFCFQSVKCPFGLTPAQHRKIGLLGHRLMKSKSIRLSNNSTVSSLGLTSPCF